MKLKTTNGFFFEIDPDDAERVKKHKWYGRKTNKKGRVYICTHINGKNVALAHFLIGRRKGFQVDHADRNTLNNRKSNLRFATPAENMRNSLKPVGKSGFRGVHWNSDRSENWRVEITVNYKKIRLNGFSCPKEAAKAYDNLAREHHGEFAILNFPEHKETP